MKLGKFAGLLLVGLLPFVANVAYSEVAESDKKSDKEDMSAGEPALRTAYELRVIGKHRSEIASEVEKRIKDNDEVLRAANCIDATPRRTRAEKTKAAKSKTSAIAVAYSCKNPNAQTDDFFRSLLSIRTASCGSGVPPAKLITYSYATSGPCMPHYCCGQTTVVLCNSFNPKNIPCAPCSSQIH